MENQEKPRRVRFSVDIEFTVLPDDYMCEPSQDCECGECDHIAFDVLKRWLENGTENEDFDWRRKRDVEYWSSTLEEVEEL